jgi:hypothetical protein
MDALGHFGCSTRAFACVGPTSVGRAARSVRSRGGRPGCPSASVRDRVDAVWTSRSAPR